MGDAYFYHLTRSPLEEALRLIVERALARGWRVVVRGSTPARMDWLDEKLWLAPEDGFLPHGTAGGQWDSMQPVLLTTGTGIANGAVCLITIDGAALGADEVAGLERACILFDGGDDAALARAREQWRDLTGAGIVAQYWSEEGGAWQKKAQSGSAQAT